MSSMNVLLWLAIRYDDSLPRPRARSTNNMTNMIIDMTPKMVETPYTNRTNFLSLLVKFKLKKIRPKISMA